MKTRHFYKHIIVVDKPTELIFTDPDRLIISASDYVANKSEIDLRRASGSKVVNLCTNYEYLSLGYYCSLLADARQQRCIPSAIDIVNISWRRLHQGFISEINAMLEKQYKNTLQDQVAQTFLIYFGRIENEGLQHIARRIYDIFRFPIIALELRYAEKWVVAGIKPWSIEEIPLEKISYFNESLNAFTGAAWKRADKSKHEKYWLAILHDPQDKLAPSNKAALNKFIKVGKQMNVFVELITKNDLPTLLEFDALFIRETTAINNHTFRFAHKAENEGIPVIDDTVSIIKCCNKVFQYELLSSNNVLTPKTLILDRKVLKQSDLDLEFPLVLKSPDSSFSLGVYKVNSKDEFRTELKKLFLKSDLILAQEFLKSDFDWRVGVLNKKALFACQYFMAENHWQVYNHSTHRKQNWGKHKTWDVNDVPKEVIDTAVLAASLIGDGFYGVDLKQTSEGVFVIEVNDNPNIESDLEDEVIGDELYRRIIQHLIDKIESD